MNLGKELRMRSFFHENAKCSVIIPMDHGITNGPIDGIDDIKKMISILGGQRVNGIILHKGIINACEKEIVKADVPVIMHLSAGTSLSPNKERKIIVGSVSEAVSFGCQAVSVHINLGNEYEEDMLRDVSKVAEDCYKFGMPLLAMMYPRGKQVENKNELELVKHAARVGAELGADMVKVQFTGGSEFQEVVDGCPVPVIIAGGNKFSQEEDFLELLSTALKTGIRGISVGRNIFQSKNPENLLERVNQLIDSLR